MALQWVVEQWFGGQWVACGHGPYDSKAEADLEATTIGVGLTAGPFRVAEVEEPEPCPDCNERPCHPQCLSGGGLT